jgi:catechol 2,3-dioxygenase-like lactoylglutathione lyase family enzyme
MAIDGPLPGAQGRHTLLRSRSFTHLEDVMAEGTLDARGLAPALTVNDLQASLRFYTEGLGFEVAQENEAEGVVRFYMLKSGNALLGIGQDDFAKGRDRLKGVGTRFWLTTAADIHALAARAKAAGITLDSEPEPLPWGPMGFSFTDPDGFKFTISNEA